MKRYSIIIMFVCAFLCACTGQDDIYKQFVIDGGRTYPAKAVNVEAIAGFQKVTLKWEKPTDPAVMTSRLYWNSKLDSVEVAYDSNGKAEYVVNKLEDRSYTFYIVNFDAKGNRSLDYEVSANPYGNNWLISHSERTAVGVSDGDSTVITFSRATYQMAYTRVAYMNTSGQIVEVPHYLEVGQDTLVLRDAMRGKKFFYKSAYMPENGTDVVENTSWTKSAMAITYPLDASTWIVSATTGQVQGSFTPDKIFDGLTTSGSGRYISSSAEAFRDIFPKILVVDTNAEPGKEPTVLYMDFYQHPAGSAYRYLRDVLVYIGNTSFDPDAGESYVDLYGTPSANIRLSIALQVQPVYLNSKINTGRYFALVFPNSNNTESSFIDLWELVPYGFIEGESEIDYPTF